jgi:hypothetical protein
LTSEDEHCTPAQSIGRALNLFEVAASVSVVFVITLVPESCLIAQARRFTSLTHFYLLTTAKCENYSQFAKPSQVAIALALPTAENAET